jgi:hypothetical protein
MLPQFVVIVLKVICINAMKTKNYFLRYNAPRHTGNSYHTQGKAPENLSIY